MFTNEKSSLNGSAINITGSLQHLCGKEVFIAYRNGERYGSIGHELHDALGNKDISCFFALDEKDGYRYGDNYNEWLPMIFENIKLTVVLLTENCFGDYGEDDVLKRELEIAMNNHEMIFLPIYVDYGSTRTLGDDILKFIKCSRIETHRIVHINPIDYKPLDEKCISDVVETVQKMLNNPNDYRASKVLYDLPNELERDYEVELQGYALPRTHDDNFVKELEIILEDFKENNRLEAVAYNAYYALHLIYRRLKKNDKIKRLIDEYHELFELHPSAKHLVLMYYCETRNYDEYYHRYYCQYIYENKNIKLMDCNEFFLMEAFDDARGNKKHVGYMLLFEYAFADMILLPLLGKSEKRALMERWFDTVFEFAKYIVFKHPDYAKYHANLSRMYLIKGDKKMALQSIDKAIALENINRDDYYMRVIDYNFIKSQICDDEHEM